MTRDGRVGIGRLMLFWAIALGGTAFDLTTKSMVFAKFGPPLLDRIRSCPASSSCTPVTTRARFGALDRGCRGAVIFSRVSPSWLGS